MPTDDVVPIVADDLRAAVDNDAIHRHPGGDRPVPNRVGLLADVVNTIAQDVQHGPIGMEGSICQEVLAALDSLQIRQSVVPDELILFDRSSDLTPNYFGLGMELFMPAATASITSSLTGVVPRFVPLCHISIPSTKKVPAG
jgi:hypothetical protein